KLITHTFLFWAGYRKEILFRSKYSTRVSKRANSGAQSLEPAGGGPARPLRRSSQQSILERVKYKRKKIAYPDLRLE
ncbi:hypothetical protein PIB30_098047, partial [Stylosanthes scabra]|nr:hypothetical protein [Stylosanthes scabra]